MELETVERSANLVMPISGKDLTERIKIRRQLMKTPAEYTFWGRALKIVFEPGGMSKPDPATLDHPVIFANWISWEDDDPFCAPVLALSRDQQELLIIGDVKRPPEVFGPDRDDVRTWVPTTAPGWQGFDRAGIPGTAGKMPRRYPQRYSDLTTQFIPNTLDVPNFSNPDCFLALQPVYQILLKITGEKQPGIIEPQTDVHGMQMCFLINPKTQEGHLVGGKIGLNLRLHTLPDKAKP